MTQKLFSCAFSLFILIWSGSVWGQDTLRLSELNFKQSLIQSAVVLPTSSDMPADEAWQKLKESAHKQSGATVGFTSNIFWIAASIFNDSQEAKALILEVDNPQIDWLYFYRVDSAGRCTLMEATGDKLLFDKRPLLHRNFALPIQLASGESHTILIKIDKRNSSLTFPIYLWNEDDFHEKTYSENLWFGIFFGTIVLCLAYALMAFIFLRKALYGWYFLLVLTSAAYLFTALGYSFQYVYPKVLDFNSYFRVYIIVSLSVLVSKFSQSFLNLPKFQPRISQWINYILLLFACIAFLSIFTLDFLTRNGLWIIPIINGLMLGGGFLLIYGAFRSFPQQRTTVTIYFMAWGSLLMGYLIMTASEFGIIAVEDLPVNPVLIGSSLEAFIFSIGLTYQVKKIYTERNLLSLSMARQQKELLKAYVEGTEKERERIARELHDDIGSRLGSLKRFISTKDKNVELEKQIDIICRDVRAMSHQLSPPSIHVSGLRQLVHQLIEELRQQTKLQIEAQYYDLPESLNGEMAHHLFRIVQEGLNNIIKHAQATEVDLQFFVHDNELVLTIEDNGQGFDTHKHQQGIGIQNMRVRTDSLNGSIEISSTHGNGTSIMIRVPLANAPSHNSL